MSEFPAPLVPPECDLNTFPEMPIEVERLRRSAAWRACKRNPELAFYMMNLWLASWHEVPAGSLEDDDEALADLAMCDDRKWAKVKDSVLRGWVKCSDGRLYHPVVSEKALGALKHKRTQSLRGQAGAAARWRKDDRPDASAMLAPLPEDSEGNPTPMLPNGNERSERIERLERSERDARAHASEGFDQFWEEYPHKVGEAAAETAYAEALKHADHPIIVAGVRQYARTKPPDRQWCNPAKWLAERRWLDEPAPVSRLNGAHSPGPDPPEPPRDKPTGPPPPINLPH